ncbi:MAG: nucleoside deaminase [Actinobacteria bacterium]|nr:nucleoside deaminase [Actinomycetota bacterium]
MEHAEQSTHEHFMRIALNEARMAAESGEVPVGAVIERGGEVIAVAGNEREEKRDPTAHAEMIAIRDAAKNLGGWRLSGCTIYVTIEPCPMCAGAIYQARIERLVYGAPDEKAGATGTLMDITRDPRLNHQTEVTGGILADECAAVMREFFSGRR